MKQELSKKFKNYKTAFKTVGLHVWFTLHCCTSIHGLKPSIDTWIRDELERAAVRHRQSTPAGGVSLIYGVYIGDKQVSYFDQISMCSTDFEDQLTKRLDWVIYNSWSIICRRYLTWVIRISTKIWKGCFANVYPLAGYTEI
jgi:hypothetical protein